MTRIVEETVVKVMIFGMLIHLVVNHLHNILMPFIGYFILDEIPIILEAPPDWRITLQTIYDSTCFVVSASHGDRFEYSSTESLLSGSENDMVGYPLLVGSLEP